MTDSEKVEILSKAINKFGWRLYSELMEDKENVFFSPFSISIALSMLLKGAKDKTAKELKNNLGFEAVELSDKEVHSSFCSLLDIFSANQESFTLSTVNVLVCQKDFQILPNYISDLKKIYKALVMDVDLDSCIRIVLLNCIYFKGFWESQFHPEDTYVDSFYNKGVKSNAKNVRYMHMSKKCLFVKKDSFSALELPCKNHLAILLLLPDKNDGLEKLEKEFTSSFFKDVIKALSYVEVDISIPKFCMEYSKELENRLLSMFGLSHGKADLTDLSNLKQLEVSEGVHKAAVEINEEGAESAAATAVPIEWTPFHHCPYMHIESLSLLLSLIGLNYLGFNSQFNADHPFLFVVYHKRCNLILFIGRVEEL